MDTIEVRFTYHADWPPIERWTVWDEVIPVAGDIVDVGGYPRTIFSRHILDKGRTVLCVVTSTDEERLVYRKLHLDKLRQQAAAAPSPGDG